MRDAERGPCSVLHSTTSTKENDKEKPKAKKLNKRKQKKTKSKIPSCWQVVVERCRESFTLGGRCSMLHAAAATKEYEKEKIKE